MSETVTIDHLTLRVYRIDDSEGGATHVVAENAERAYDLCLREGVDDFDELSVSIVELAMDVLISIQIDEDEKPVEMTAFNWIAQYNRQLILCSTWWWQ